VNPLPEEEFRGNPCPITLESAVTSKVIAYNQGNHAGRSYFALPNATGSASAADAAAAAELFQEG